MFYKLAEDGTNEVFGVVRVKVNKKGHAKGHKLTKKLVELAVLEEWKYASVKFSKDRYLPLERMTFDCVTKDGDKEVRVIDLNVTRLYYYYSKEL